MPDTRHVPHQPPGPAAVPGDARRTSLKTRPPRPAPLRRHYLLAAVLYTTFIVYGSWVPLRPASLSLEDAWAQYVAVLSAIDGRPGRVDFFTNVIIFVPLSFLWTAAVLTDRRPLAWLPGAVLVAAGTSALSLAIEFGQVWVERTPSRFDVYAQLLGAAAGILAWLAAGRRITGWLRSFVESGQPNDRLDWVLKTYLALLFVAALMPLDLTLHPFDLYEKYKSGRIVLVPFANGARDYESLLDLLFDALLAVPVGALGVRMWRGGRSSARALPAGIAAGIGLIAAIEFAQLFVMSRFTEAGDVLVGAAGVTAGACLMWLAQRSVGRSFTPSARVTDGVELRPTRGGRRLVWLVLALAWLGVPCLFFWSPFDFTADPDVIRAGWDEFIGIPFYSLYATSNLNAHTQLLRKVLLFVPVGLLLAPALWRADGRPPSTGMVAAAVAGIALAAFGVELGQVFLPERYPDITDAALMAAGGVLGLWLAFQVASPRAAAASLACAPQHPM